MQPRTLLILTLVVALLGAFIYFYEKELPSTGEQAELEKKVLSLEKDEIRAVVLEHDGVTVRLERDPPAAADEDDTTPEVVWRLVEPYRARADRYTVRGLVDGLAGLEKVRSVDSPDREALGLAEPRAKVTLVSGDGEPVETVVEVGIDMPGTHQMMVGVAGRAYQVPSSVWTEIVREPGEWRDKKLFHAARDDIERVSLRREDTTVLLARRGDEMWIESPVTDRADEEQVNALLGQVTRLEAERFVDDPPALADLGLEPPVATFEAVLEGGETFTLDLGAAVEAGAETAEEEEEDEYGDYGSGTGEVPAHYARIGEQVVEIATELEVFELAPEGWRSRKWTRLQPFKIESARFEEAGREPIQVTRADADWQRGDDKVSYSSVSDVLYACADARAEEVLDRGEATIRDLAVEDPAITVHLTPKRDQAEDDDEEGESKAGAEVELRLFPVVEGRAVAWSSDREAYLVVTEETFDSVRDKLQALRDAEPLQEPKEEAAAGAEDTASAAEGGDTP